MNKQGELPHESDIFAKRHIPNMSRYDTRLMLKHIETYSTAPISAYANVRLGPGAPPYTNKNEHLKRMWHQITAKRADLILLWPHTWEIIEFRHHATAAALGSLAEYRELFRADFRPQLPVKATLVSDQLPAASTGIAKMLDINTVLVRLDK